MFAGIALTFLAGCKTKATATPTTMEIAVGRVHVLLVDGVAPDVLLEPFANYSFKTIGPASRAQNKHAYSYNTAAVTAKALEAELESRKDVLEAEVMQ